MMINGVPQALMRIAQPDTMPTGLTAQQVRNGFERMFRDKGMSRSQARAEVSALASASTGSARQRGQEGTAGDDDVTEALSGLLASLRG